MPIEIRELIIKTEISSANKNRPADLGTKEIEAFKNTVIGGVQTNYRYKNKKEQL